MEANLQLSPLFTLLPAHHLRSASALGPSRSDDDETHVIMLTWQSSCASRHSLTQRRVPTRRGYTCSECTRAAPPL
eukprot:2091934-Rhodomonas_salina.6